MQSGPRIVRGLFSWVTPRRCGVAVVSGLGRRFPEVDPIRDELERTKWIWVACCVAPLIYLLAAHWIQRQWFHEKGHAGLLTLEGQTRSLLAIIFLGAQILLQGAVTGVRHYFGVQLTKNRPQGIKVLMALYRKRTLVLCAISETAALLGFLYFLAVGDFRALFVGGVAAYIFYAQSYPSEHGLARYLQ